MGQRAILPGKLQGFLTYLDIERLGSRIGNDRSHGPTTPVVAGDEMQQQVALGVLTTYGREFDNEGGE